MGDTILDSFDTIHQYEQVPKTHTLRLVLENGLWQIADYDNTLTEMKDYIINQREYLRSDEYNAMAKALLNA